jgi:hypothetical protein
MIDLDRGRFEELTHPVHYEYNIRYACVVKDKNRTSRSSLLVCSLQYKVNDSLSSKDFKMSIYHHNTVRFRQ